MQGYPSPISSGARPVAGLATLNEHQLLGVLLHLAPVDAVRISMTSKLEVFHRSALMDSLWERHVRQIFDLQGDGLKGCEDAQVPSWKESYRSWHEALRNLSGSAATEAVCHGTPAPCARWVQVWTRLRAWLKATSNAKAISETLQPGAKDKDLTMLREYCPAVSPAVLDCWRLVNGQDAPLDHQGGPWTGGTMSTLSDGEDWSKGLLGGYQTYHHTISNIFLPLPAALKITKKLRDMLAQVRSFQDTSQLDNKLVFGASFNLAKFLFVDLATGEVFIFTRKPWSPFEAAVPREGKACDGFLRWFEEYVRRLQSKYYEMDFISPAEAPTNVGISLFPTSAPDLTVCVTRGVEVRASPIYMPEHDAGWTYSIALRLVGTAAERGFERCQLLTRHWEIHEDGKPEPERVEGEGVIGLFPILVDGGWLANLESDPHRQYQAGRTDGLFRYQSCSGRFTNMKGSFGGSITFVPGTKRSPEGPPFRVRVEPFRLYVPDYLY